MNNSPIFGGSPYYPTTPYPYGMGSNIAYPSTNNVRSVIPGRSVSSLDDIVASEVPLDGTPAIFPKTDGSAIYVRSMNGDMSVNTRTYIPAPTDYNEDKTEDSTPVVTNADIMNNMVNLTDQMNDIKNLLRNMNKNNSYSKSKNNQGKNNSNQSRNDQNGNGGDEVNA